MITRRALARGLALTGLGLGGPPALATAPPGWPDAFARACATIEAASGGRLGARVRDTGSTVVAGHRAAERFAMCSTSKLVTAAAVLARVDAGEARLTDRLVFAARDLVDYSPVTRSQVGRDGMTLAALCAAAVAVSDNTAANVLLERIGGPAGWTRFVRSLGDTVTRLDRNEPTLNEATPGDPRDTTTPDAMAGHMDRLLFGPALSDASRRQLADWLRSCATGGGRIRAGLPPDWIVGDKTGTGGHGSTNDVAVIWPPGRAPLVLAVYLTRCDRPVAAREATIAAVARAVVGALAP